MALNINGTTGISGVDGSASAPAVTGTDSNTGINFGSDSIKFSTGGVERMSITNSGVTGTGIGAGKILQVVQNVKTDTASQAGAIATALNFDSLFSQAITPSSSSNKIEVSFNLSVSLSTAPNQIFFRLRRKIGSGSFADITDIMGNTAGSRYRCMHSALNPSNVYMMPTINLNFLDSPSTTDAVTYSFSAAHDSGSTRTIFLNREGGGYSDSYVARGASSIILREVAA